MISRITRAVALSLSFSAAILPAAAYASQPTADTPREERGKAASAADAETPTAGSIVKTLWASDNVFGHGSGWVEHSTSGENTTHFLFTGADGATIEVTKNRSGGRLLLPKGEMQLTRLPNGNFSLHLFSNENCATDVNHGPSEGTVILDVSGQPVGDSSRAKSVQYTLACASADVATEFLNFAAMAGLSVSSHSGSHARTEGLFSCILAAIGLGLAFAAFALEPIDPLAYWAFIVAWAGYEDACEI